MFVRNLVLLLFSATATLSTTCPDNGLSSLGSIRLKNDLVSCDYDKTIRPVKNHNDSTNVMFKIILKYFTYEIHSSTLSIDAWLSVYWKDQHLKWTPSDYDGIKNFYISSDDIWIPDISVYNRADQSGDPKIVGSTQCVVSSEGSVSCVPPSHMDALCVANIKKFPFDTQNCSLRFGSWIFKGEELNITLADVDRDDLEPNGEWEIIDVQRTKHPGVFTCCPNSTYPSIHVNFIIKRLSGSHTASVVIPALVAVVLTLTSLWISPTNKDRFALCSVNLLTHFLHLQYVSWMVPMKGDQVPLLILFARDSLLLCSFTVVFTILLKNIVEKKNSPPGWISSIVSFVVSCRVGQFAFLNDYSTKGIASFTGEEDGATIVNNSESNSNVQDWIVFAKILDRLCFIVYVIVYFVMIVEFAP